MAVERTAVQEQALMEAGLRLRNMEVGEDAGAGALALIPSLPLGLGSGCKPRALPEVQWSLRACLTGLLRGCENWRLGT